MSQIWVINGLSLELDLEDYETNIKYRNAFKQMEADEKKLSKDGDGGSFIKGYCQIFYSLYDNLFGKDMGYKILGTRFNSRTCDEVYSEFLAFVKEQQVEAQSRRAKIMEDYIPHKSERRTTK